MHFMLWMHAQCEIDCVVRDVLIFVQMMVVIPTVGRHMRLNHFCFGAFEQSRSVEVSCVLSELVPVIHLIRAVVLGSQIFYLRVAFVQVGLICMDEFDTSVRYRSHSYVASQQRMLVQAYACVYLTSSCELRCGEDNR